MLLIRRALDDILAGEPKSEWDAFSLKADYLDMIDELDKDWGPVQQGEEEDQIVRIGGERLPPALGWIPYAAKRYVWNEPQRSRRVLRLAFANWLANAQEKDPQYLKPTVRATFQIEKRPTTVYLYAVNPVGRSAARELTPRVLAEWLVGTRDAKFLLSGWPWPAIRATERREYPRWSCYWRVSSTSATTEHPLLPTKCWWGHISMSFRPTGRPSSMTAAPR